MTQAPLAAEADQLARLHLQLSQDAHNARDRVERKAHRLASILGIVASVVSLWDLSLLARMGSH